MKQDQIKHTLTRQVNANTIATVVYGIFDSCGNGYNHFEFNCKLWATNGDRKYGKHEEYKSKCYYFLEDVREEKDVRLYFPELINIFLLHGCDSYGVETYPLLNGGHYLLKGELKTAAGFYRISLPMATKIAKYNQQALFCFVISLINSTYKTQVGRALKEIKETTGIEYDQKELVSPVLWNDINYIKNGGKSWNDYKGRQAEIKEYQWQVN